MTPQAPRHSVLRRLLLVGVALASNVLPWDVPCVDALNVDLYGVNYDLRQGPDWDPNKCKSADQVSSDLRTLAAVTSRIRTYSLTDCPIQPVLEAAKNLQLSVWLGVWTASDPAIFDQEVLELETLLQQQHEDFTVADGAGERPTVSGINVGSEVVYRKDVSVEVAVANVDRVRAVLRSANITNIPVSVTDIVDVLVQYPDLIAAGDVVTANIFPFWERVPVQSAAAHFDARMAPLIALAGTMEKPIIITETGWASAGKNVNSSEASPANAAQYLNDFVGLAQYRGWNYYYFAGFDSPYKAQQLQDPESVEQSFGLFDAAGNMKPEIADLVIMPYQPPASQDGETSTSGSSSSSPASGNSEDTPQPSDQTAEGQTSPSTAAPTASTSSAKASFSLIALSPVLAIACIAHAAASLAA